MKKNIVAMVLGLAITSVGTARADAPYVPEPQATTVIDLVPHAGTPDSLTVAAHGSGSAEASSGTAKAKAAGDASLETELKKRGFTPLKPASSKPKASVAKARTARRTSGSSARSGAEARIVLNITDRAKLEELLNRLAKLEARDTVYNGANEALNKEMGEVREQIASLTGRVTTLETRVDTVKHRVDELEKAEAADVQPLAKRLQVLEQTNPFGHSLTLHVDGVLMGLGHVSSSNIGAGAKLDLALTNKLFIFVDPSFLLSFGGKHPTGAMLAGGAGYVVSHKANFDVAIQGGVAGSAFGIRNDLHADAMAVTGFGGVELMFHNHLTLSGALHGGASFADHGPGGAQADFIGGAVVGAGYHF